MKLKQKYFPVKVVPNKSELNNRTKYIQTSLRVKYRLSQVFSEVSTETFLNFIDNGHRNIYYKIERK